MGSCKVWFSVPAAKGSGWEVTENPVLDALRRCLEIIIRQNYFRMADNTHGIALKVGCRIATCESSPT
jgi:hypothetical protein